MDEKISPEIKAAFDAIVALLEPLTETQRVSVLAAAATKLGIAVEVER